MKVRMMMIMMTTKFVEHIVRHYVLVYFID